MTALLPHSADWTPPSLRGPIDRRPIAERIAAANASLAHTVAEIETVAAPRSARGEIKHLARLYVRRPELIDNVQRGASLMPLPLLLGRLQTRLAFHRSAEAFDGCLLVPINLRAAILATRLMLAREHADERREAAE